MLIMSKADDSAPKLTNFEEMFSKTRSMAETINKKGAMYLELSRKKIEYMDAKSKLSKAYENFGKLQFSAYIGEEVDENEYACSIADITALKERTETLSAELEEAKNKDAEELKKRRGGISERGSDSLKRSKRRYSSAGKGFLQSGSAIG